MEAKAYLKYLRIAPRKVQIVADLIRADEGGEDGGAAAPGLEHLLVALGVELLDAAQELR